MCMCVCREGICGNSVLSTQFCGPKTVLKKKKSDKKKKRMRRGGVHRLQTRFLVHIVVVC